MKLIAIITVFLLLLSGSGLSPIRECANCGGSCGVTPHSFWIDFGAVEDGEAPMYAMCRMCGYSFYIDHVRIEQEGYGGHTRTNP